MEQESGRTTRSRRSTAKSPAKTTPPRATRSTRGRPSKEESLVESTEEIEHMDTDQSEDPTIEAREVLEQLQNLSGNCDEDDLLHSDPEPFVVEPKPTVVTESTEENSATFPFGQEDQTDTLPHADSESEPITTIITANDDNEFVASLAVEDNANSLPSENLNEDTNEITEVHAEETSSSDNALAEDIANGGGDSNATETKADPDAEMVSEDELPPAPEKIIVKDADEVSDEELPGPKMAELPEDTEVVSEDELKTDTPKRKHEDGDNESSPKSGSVEKKAKIDTIDGKEEEKKKLPDLDKYWKAVNDDSTDFTAWTYLLQYVDHENDIEAAREAYDAFLAHYCYCYGYWRKYADYEKRKGNKKKCEEVFERGLKAIPLSVDLWIHYLSYCKETQADNEEFVRSQFERALNACGLEFRSDKLWEAYIRWETEGKRIKNVVGIYDKLLATPTQGYTTHFENFQDLVNSNSVLSLIPVKEFKKIRDDLRAKEDKVEQSDDVPPGEDEPDDHYRSEEELQSIKNKIISIRKKIHKANVSAVSARWTYEEGIKRPYFHVKPLERIQLKNWKEYLDYEIEQGNQTRILVLFERCLIACALYDEFWLKLIRYLETQTDENAVARTRDAYERACTIHHPDKPSLHLMWAGFEEAQGNVNKAAEILATLDNKIPNILQVAYKRINVERRRGDIEKCVQLYENYINNAKNKSLAGNLAIKYARFLNKIKKDIEAAIKMLKGVMEKDPSNTRVALQLIDLLLQRDLVDPDEVVQVMDVFVARDNIEPEQKVLFAQRKVEFLEDFGKDCKTLQEAQKQLQSALAKANEGKKKSDDSSRQKSKDSNPPLPSTAGASYPSNTAGYNYGTAQQQAYYGDPNYQYGYAQWNQQYNQSYYGGYSGYNYGY